ncbi:unnamed protein product [Didymodactylos carnosus]|uniref:Cilia- and flagella-associated protein 251 n=1 Tax=Didymodactylos carnosus TaxID=1234261 RepID=A0A814AU82_9BILA|nr:unnamed protein product [Didymodactylos carnosus]CAF1291542.1 unnamed protein product [Didymodactylos carnosus]CAF3698293.1 unnamed protein product [Didymodactylos carnosus]CAF4096313.1 unnamed protein product [Didymodactylos carnosus]
MSTQTSMISNKPTGKTLLTHIVPLAEMDSDLFKPLPHCQDCKTCLKLSWTVGMNISIPIINMTVGGKTRYFYVLGNVGILASGENNDNKESDFIAQFSLSGSGKAQIILQGHVNRIVSASVSNDKQWLITAESGVQAFCIVWNAYTGQPVKYLTDIHEHGICQVYMSKDAKLVAILTEVPQQKIVLWRWSNDESMPTSLPVIPLQCEQQTFFTMLENHSLFCSCGHDSAIFYIPSKDSETVRLEVHNDIQKKLRQRTVQIIFCYMLPDSKQAVIITKTGKAIFFDVEYAAVGLRSSPDQTRYQQFIVTSATTFNKPSHSTTNIHDSVSTTSSAGIVRENQVYVVETVMKRLHDLQRQITAIEYFSSHIIIGTETSQIVVYDSNLHFIKQYSLFGIGPLYSIAVNKFSDGDRKETIDTLTSTEKIFELNEVICGSNSAVIITQKNFQLIKIVQIMPLGQITDICLRAVSSVLLVGTSIGHLYVWHGESRVLFIDKQISSASTIGISKLCLSGDGSHLAVGLDNGLIWVYDAATYNPLNNHPLHNSRSPVTLIEYSPNGIFLAAIVDSTAVSLYIRDAKKSNIYHNYGRCVAHFNGVSAILFTEDKQTKRQCLFSCGGDGDLVEYTVDGERLFPFGVQSRSNLCDYPYYAHSVVQYSSDPKNHYLVCSISDARIKFIELATKRCRWTIQVFPQYQIYEQIKVWPVDCNDQYESNYLAFRSTDYIGVMKLPGTGSPTECDLILAHGGGVQTIDVATGRNVIVSCGRKDSCIFIWKFDLDCMKKRLQQNQQNPMKNFYSLLDWSSNDAHSEYRDLELIFYYIQLQDSTNLKINEKIPLTLVPDFARAIGVYLSERKIQELYDELCYTKQISNPRDIYIDFSEVIRIYFNHLTSIPTSSIKIIKTFFEEVTSNQQNKNATLNIHDLLQILVTEGERMTIDELREAFYAVDIFTTDIENFHDLSENYTLNEFLKLFSRKDSNGMLPNDEHEAEAFSNGKEEDITTINEHKLMKSHMNHYSETTQPNKFVVSQTLEHDYVDILKPREKRRDTKYSSIFSATSSTNGPT